MARYLERLIARSGIMSDVPPASPSWRSPLEHDLSAATIADPFEPAQGVAPEADPVWPLQSASSSPSGHSDLREEAPYARGSRESPELHTAELKTERFIVETIRPQEPFHMPPRATANVERVSSTPGSPPSSLTPEVDEVNANPILFKQESDIADPWDMISPGIGAEPAVANPIDPPSIDESSIERNVLDKLMPALDAWFAADSIAAAPSTPAARALTPSMPGPRESEAPAIMDTPQLVIGSIYVEVTQPQAPSMPQPAAAPATRFISRVPRPAPGHSASRLGLGLGQM